MTKALFDNSHVHVSGLELILEYNYNGVVNLVTIYMYIIANLLSACSDRKYAIIKYTLKRR